VVWGDRGEATLLTNAYRNALQLALKNGINSIAFPAISTGVYAYPKEEAARIALDVMKEFENRFERIIAACHSEEDVKIYQSVLVGMNK